MSSHYLFVPEHEPDDDVDYVLQHPNECFKGYGAHGPQMECEVAYQLENAGFDGLFDHRSDKLQPGHWLIDAVHEVIPSGPWGPTEHDMHWEILELRKTVQAMEEVPEP